MTYRDHKRILDFLGALFGIVVTFPVIVIIASMAAVVQGRPIFFVQVRAGKSEKPFKLFKFRTMPHNQKATNQVPSSLGPTRFGSFLRASSLDELPQLLNILLGHMSFVGPRPLLMEYLPLYSEVQKIRHEVRPGLTGMAQVAGRNKLGWESRLALDVQYVRTQSFLVDCKILARTVSTVISGRDVQPPGGLLMPKFRGEGIRH